MDDKALGSTLGALSKTQSHNHRIRLSPDSVKPVTPVARFERRNASFVGIGLLRHWMKPVSLSNGFLAVISHLWDFTRLFPFVMRFCGVFTAR